MVHTSCCTETFNVTEYMYHIQLVVLYGMAGYEFNISRRLLSTCYERNASYVCLEAADQSQRIAFPVVRL